jgi:hypothetical protein
MCQAGGLREQPRDEARLDPQPEAGNCRYRFFNHSGPIAAGGFDRTGAWDLSAAKWERTVMKKLIPIAGVAALAASTAAFAEPDTAPAKAGDGSAAKVQTVRMPNGRVARLSSDNRVRPASACAAPAKTGNGCLPMGDANKMAGLAKKSGTD